MAPEVFAASRSQWLAQLPELETSYTAPILAGASDVVSPDPTHRKDLRKFSIESAHRRSGTSGSDHPGMPREDIAGEPAAKSLLSPGVHFRQCPQTRAHEDEKPSLFCVVLRHWKGLTNIGALHSLNSLDMREAAAFTFKLQESKPMLVTRYGLSKSSKCS